MIGTLLSRFLQRSAVFRFLLLPVLFMLFLSLIAGISVLAFQKPSLVSITPSIAEPGEVLVLRGRHFGNEQGDNWIEIGGGRLSESSFISWTDTTIMATIPEITEDGLVYVINKHGKSNPLIFANKKNIPVAVRENNDAGLPFISSIGDSQTSTGKSITIYGRNFGITRNKSTVLFSWQIDSAIPVSGISRNAQSSIACAEHDFDYEFWSDMELQVRVPDGAVSGNMYIETEQGLSNPISVEILNPAGTKKYVNRHTYVLSLQVDITDVLASDGNMLFLQIPRPEVSASQRSVEVTASSPKPYIENYRGVILHQLENLKSGKNEKITHSYLLTNYGIATSINPAIVKPYSDSKSPLYMMYTAADRIVNSDNQEIILRASAITGTEKNPYLKARMIYAWVKATIAETEVKNPDRTLKEVLQTETGDAYDRAILFASLARAAGVPAIPVAGILVDTEQNSRMHWWAEFYIENFGWVPCDPSLEGENNFGNLDVYHIAFSRGWIEQKPMAPKSRIVYKPRTFAFQPIWEESGGNIKSYTSYWAEPKVTGTY